jgi:hypothetical protein
MSMFKQRKPRPFSHKYIYVDERADRLREIEERAKRELGMLPPKGYDPDSVRGAFSANSRLRHSRGGQGFTGSLVLIAAIVLLVLMLAYCLSA